MPLLLGMGALYATAARHGCLVCHCFSAWVPCMPLPLGMGALYATASRYGCLAAFAQRLHDAGAIPLLLTGFDFLQQQVGQSMGSTLCQRM